MSDCKDSPLFRNKQGIGAEKVHIEFTSGIPGVSSSLFAGWSWGAQEPVPVTIKRKNTFLFILFKYRI